MTTDMREETLWQMLTRPHASVTGRQAIRQARTLAGVTLVLLFVDFLIMVAYAVATGRIMSWEIAVLLALALAYGLSRSARPRLSALTVVIFLLITNFVILVVLRSDITVRNILFLMLPSLIAALLLSSTMTIATAAASILGLLLFGLLAAWVDFSQAFTSIVSLTFVLTLVVVTALLRERDIQTIEQQSEAVDTVSRLLQVDMQRIALTSEVGRAITAIRNMDALLKRVVSLIVEQADFYHAQVFLIDEAGRYAVLSESTGEAGRELLARQHRLAVGSQSVIGQVTARGEPVIASDTDTDVVHRRNELLPYTRAEMALPLRIGDRVIGALDIQSIHPDAFDERDLAVFQTMADQLAVAIENTRLFERAQRDLTNIERLNRQLTGEAWRQYASGRSTANVVGYLAGEQGVKPLAAGDEE
nr:GAF domain-containing protein [Anaerolineae bacterium]